MDFREWFLSLPDSERQDYARRAGTTPGYIRVHLIGRRKIPRPELMERLAGESSGEFTVQKLLAFFYRTEAAKKQPAQQAALASRKSQLA